MAGTTHYSFEVIDPHSNVWKIEIKDNTYGGTDTIDLTGTTGSDGFSINWSGAGDGTYQPIISSDFECRLDLSPDTLALFDSIVEGPECRFIVLVFKNSTQFASYYLLQDSMSKPDAGNGTDFITLTGTDGFGLLKDIDFAGYDIDALLRYPYVHWLSMISSKLPIAYNTGSIFALASVWYEDSQITSIVPDPEAADPLANTFINESAFLEVDQYGEVKAKSYYDILTALLSIQGLQISQCNGIYLLIQPNTYAQASTRAWYYDSAGNYVTTGLITLSQAIPQRMSGGVYTYILPAKEVTTEYEYRQGIYRNNLFPFNVDPETEYSLGLSAQNAEIRFSGQIETIFNGSGGDLEMIQAVYKLLIKNGTKYLHLNASDELEWNTSSASYVPVKSRRFKSDYAGDQVVQSLFDILTTLPEEDEPITFEWQFYRYELFEENTLWDDIANTNTSTHDDIEGTFIARINTGVAMEGTILYKAHISNEARADIELDGVELGDGANKYSAGALFVNNNVPAIVLSNVWTIYSEIGGTAYPINSLRCREILALRRNTVEVYNGTLDGVPDIHKAIVFDTLKYCITSIGWNCAAGEYTFTGYVMSLDRTGLTVDTPLLSQETVGESISGGSSGSTPTVVPYPLMNDILEYRDNAYKPYVNKKSTLPVYPYFYINGNYPSNDEQELRVDSRFIAQSFSCYEEDQISGGVLSSSSFGLSKQVSSLYKSIIVSFNASNTAQLVARAFDGATTVSAPFIMGDDTYNGTIDPANDKFTFNLSKILFPTIGSKTTPIDADSLTLIDSADSSYLKKVTWANIKALLNFWSRNTVSGILTPVNISDQIVNENIIKSKDPTGNIFSAIDRGSFYQQSTESILQGLNYVSSTELTSGTNIVNKLVQFVKSSAYYPQFKEIINAAENWTTTSRAVEWIIESVVSGATTLSRRLRIDKDGYFYIGSATNNTSFSPTGTQRMNGSATVWNDLNIPGLSVQFAGANDPALADFGSTTKILSFSGAIMKEVFFTVQLPHTYKEGSAIEPHVHWTPIASPASSLGVRWGLDYQWQNYTDTFTATDTTVLATGSTGTVGYKHLITSFGTIAGTGKTISSILVCRLYRLPADAADTYTGDAGLLSIDFHYESDSLGSETEYGK